MRGRRRSTIQATRLNKQGSIDAAQNPTETDIRVPGRGPTLNSAKTESGILGISVSRGLGKVIVCLVFGDKRI